jgi:hypothetical protein
MRAGREPTEAKHIHDPMKLYHDAPNAASWSNMKLSVGSAIAMLGSHTQLNALSSFPNLRKLPDLCSLMKEKQHFYFQEFEKL